MKFRTIAASLMLALAVLLPAAAPVSAYQPDNYNLAGRPITGDVTDRCTALAYGKVDGKKSLFYADHCFDNQQDGYTIYGEPGFDGAPRMLGTVRRRTVSANHDLGWIELYANRWPTNPHQVYKGAYLGTPQWWTMSYKRGNSNHSCANGSKAGFGVRQNFQTSLTSTLAPRPGDIIGYNQSGTYCRWLTDLPLHGGGQKDSGTGWVLDAYPTSLFGIGNSVSQGYIVVSSMHDGMVALNNYWLQYGTQTGAFMCINAACT